MIALYLYMAFAYGFVFSMYYVEVLDDKNDLCSNDVLIFLLSPILFPYFLYVDISDRIKEKPFDVTKNK